MREAEVGQAHGHGLGAAVAAVQVPDLARFLFTHHACQEGGAVAGVHRTHLGADLAELGLVGANGQVADGGQHVAAANRKALHAGNHGLGHVADGGVQLFHGQADGTAAVVVAVVGRLVAAGAESPVASAGQHDGTDFAVVAGLVQRLDDFVASLAAKRVHLFRAVDGDPCHAVAHFVQDVFKVHGVLSGEGFRQEKSARRRAAPRRAGPPWGAAQYTQ